MNTVPAREGATSALTAPEHNVPSVTSAVQFSEEISKPFGLFTAAIPVSAVVYPAITKSYYRK